MSIRKTKKRLKRNIDKERKKCITFLVKHPELVNPWILTIFDSCVHTSIYKLKKFQELQQLKKKKR